MTECRLTSGMMGADFSVVGFLGGFSVWDMYLCTSPIVARLLTIGDGGFPNAVCAGRKVSSNTVKASQRPWRLTEPNHFGIDSICLHDLMAYACTSGEETVSVYLGSWKQFSNISYHHGTTGACSVPGSFPKTGYCVRYRHDLQRRFI